MASRGAILKAIVALSALRAAPETETRTSIVSAAWNAALPDLDDAALSRAVATCLSEEEWFPAPATLRRLAAGPPTQAMLEAENAFHVIMTKRRVRRYSPEIGDVVSRNLVREFLGPIAEAAFVACGGSRAFGDPGTLDQRDIRFLREAFVGAFARYARDPGVRARLAEGRQRQIPRPANDLLSKVEAAPAEPHLGIRRVRVS